MVLSLDLVERRVEAIVRYGLSFKEVREMDKAVRLMS